MDPETLGSPARLDTRLLTYFVAVAEDLHFRRAADRLFISQPALSRQIRRLEELLATELFVRANRSVSLTDEGRELLPLARTALQATEHVVTHAMTLRSRRHSRVRLGFVGQAANELTPRLLREFSENHPDVTVELRQRDMRDVTAGLADGSTDLALVRLPIDTTGLRVVPVLTEPRVAVLPADHPLAAAGEVSVRQLFDLPWVQPASPDPVYRSFALALDQRDGRPPRLGPTVNSIDEYLEVVLSGHGIGLAPESAARYYSRPGITYVPVPDAEPSVVALAWLAQDAPLPAAARTLLDYLRRRAGERATSAPDGKPAVG